MSDRRTKLLRTAFLAGAITDAVAVVPLLFPSMAQLLWGFEDVGGAYRFVSGYAASLMAAWTGLLVWAAERPLERAFVAPLTVLIIYGLVATEVAAVHAGALSATRMLPTWTLQVVLLGLFVTAYHYPVLARRFAA